MAIHVRHRAIYPITRRVILGGFAAALLGAAAWWAEQSSVLHISAGKNAQITTISLQEETAPQPTTSPIKIDLPIVPISHEPPPLCLIDTTPDFPPTTTDAEISLPDPIEDSHCSMALLFADPIGEAPLPPDSASSEHSPLATVSEKHVKKSTYTPPQYAATPQPRYPKDLQRRRISGSVRVRIHINAQGTPTAVDILSSSHPAFSQATQHAILTSWRFTPATNGNNSVAATVTTSVVFSCQ